MMTNPASLDELKRQLEELETLSRQGVLTGDAARAAREDLERRIVAAVTTQATAPAPVAEAAPPATSTKAAPVTRCTATGRAGRSARPTRRCASRLRPALAPRPMARTPSRSRPWSRRSRSA
ncbi:hypothetical protein CKO44_23050 [Rubrivivax gelatinosus]|uniref:hypothetical protein n=1 Tax=Rubrivivax gelatinosus TaxID=28068 RepID=UPI001906AF6D|nr:hypothetical protein [Rubrivivax gelatinosus]MBK1616327.1 hypothetical protein [Rubrivivax gelatinosus]